MITPIQIPEHSLVLLIGPSSAGKSTFARQHFKATEIVSSDFCRAAVADDENVLDANEATFAVLHLIVRKRLERGLLTVVDATNLQEESRKKLVRIARDCYLPTVGFVFNLSLQTLKARNRQRTDRQIPDRVIYRQQRMVRPSLGRLRREGIRQFVEFKNQEALAQAAIHRQPMPSNFRQLTGPFDIIGDVHGCFRELRELLQQMGYRITKHRDRTKNWGYSVKAPAGRQAVFVGDLVDRGPASNEVLRLVMSMVQHGQALCVSGNHDDKLRRKLIGKQVKIAHGLAETLDQMAQEPAEFHQAVIDFLRNLPDHLELDEGRLIVAHAGLKEKMQGRIGSAVRSFCLYGETTGEVDEFGLLVRYPWAKEYRGKAKVVYGHTPTLDPEWINGTICLDTGCVFGERLTALRYPSMELVSIPARKVYAESKRPLQAKPEAPRYTHALDAGSVMGEQRIHTRLGGHVTIREGQSAAALETMSRFAADPRQLIYLPPTMSPVKSSSLEDFLEHPAEAFAYYREQGIQRVVCQEKHMGSRAVVLVAKSEEAIESHFGLAAGIGWIHTRTGRAFFPDAELEQALLAQVQQALTASGAWARHQTDWFLLDSELMPWSAKAQQLLEEQYAAVATAGDLGLSLAVQAARQAQARGIDNAKWVQQLEARQDHVQRFRTAYRSYCWPVDQLADLRLAPFHLLATAGAVHTDKGHQWHLDEIEQFCLSDFPNLQMTRYRWVDLQDAASEAAATAWWLEMTRQGGEGMVVKPADFIRSHEGRLLQPALKVRGQEYLRIIYGPDYTLPANLRRLRKRSLGRKRSLARREFVLGVEALERFVKGASLSQVHQCAFGILALESEAVDPAL